jgi:ketosteroid isomerase-like protein
MKVEGATPAASRAGSCPSFVRALSGGDPDAAAACFARDGCLITPDATAIHGREMIRPLLGQMVLRGTRINVETSTAIWAGEVILARERWRVGTRQAPAGRLEQILDPILVLRRIEAEWKLAIAAPWGWGRGCP